jgi:hygromycin-B 4-O-kinase
VEIKPLITQSELLALLTERFGTAVSQIEPIATGQIANGFFFAANGDEYVIRFTRANMAMGLHKDAYAYTHFASPLVPVPPVICVDEYGAFTYIITQRMPGDILDRLSEEAYLQLLPSLMETLDAIHQTDVSDASGYGSFNEQGVGLASSWPEHMRHVYEEEDERWFYGKWHTLFDTTFLERDLFDWVYAEMESLLVYAPPERFLVHADFGSDNALAENGKITAVLDWANAVYGDFLYDVAWLDMWADSCSYGLDINGRFQQYYQAKNRHIPHYNERFRCCQCYIALDSFRFYAKIGNEKMYQWMKDRILGILE